MSFLILCCKTLLPVFLACFPMLRILHVYLSMHVACLPMPFMLPCTLPVYPCHASCMFTHPTHLVCLSIYAMYVACLPMPYILPVSPCHASCMFTHTVYVACLSMQCSFPVYPSDTSCLPVISLFNHAIHKKSHFGTLG